MSIYCVERVQALATTPKEQVQHNIFTYKCNNLFIIYFDIVLYNFLWFNIVFIKFSDLIYLTKNPKSDKNLFHRRNMLFAEFSTLAFDDVTIARDM